MALVPTGLAVYTVFGEYLLAFFVVLREGVEPALFQTALLGYNGNPSLKEGVAYAGYWVVVLAAVCISKVRGEPVAAPAKG